MSYITIRSSTTATAWNKLVRSAYDNAVNQLELSDSSSSPSFDKVNMRNILQPKIDILAVLKEMFTQFEPLQLDEIVLCFEHIQLIRSLMRSNNNQQHTNQ